MRVRVRASYVVHAIHSSAMLTYLPTTYLPLHTLNTVCSVWALYDVLVSCVIAATSYLATTSYLDPVAQPRVRHRHNAHKGMLIARRAHRRRGGLQARPPPRPRRLVVVPGALMLTGDSPRLGGRAASAASAASAAAVIAVGTVGGSPGEPVGAPNRRSRILGTAFSRRRLLLLRARLAPELGLGLGLRVRVRARIRVRVRVRVRVRARTCACPDGARRRGSRARGTRGPSGCDGCSRAAAARTRRGRSPS